MDNFLKFKQFREQYKEFYYNSYSIKEENLAMFHPTTKILKKQMHFKSLNTIQAKNMAFHIGLIELISYWKSVCCPQIVIKCGYLSEEQIQWWKK